MGKSGKTLCQDILILAKCLLHTLKDIDISNKSSIGNRSSHVRPFFHLSVKTQTSLSA